MYVCHIYVVNGKMSSKLDLTFVHFKRFNFLYKWLKPEPHKISSTREEDVQKCCKDEKSSFRDPYAN
jgi:hypothetical protein